MARIHPFRAWRYNPALVPVERAVTQPYDKITPQMQDRYYAACPENLVRIILGKPEPSDNPSSNVYTRAANYFRLWRQSGALQQDPAPAIYVYSQTFTEPGTDRKRERRGFIALSDIYDYDEGVVFRHEQTLAKPKADRLELLRATRAHFGQIFVLYSDPEKRVEQALAIAGSPAINVTDEYGVQHRVWPVTDSQALRAAQRAMEDKRLIIADGHHRYETALNYRNERRSAQAELAAKYASARAAGETSAHGNATATLEAAEAPHERVMMTFVNMDAEGLVILPTHRVAHGLANFDATRFIQRASEYFEVEAAPQDSAALIARLEQSRGKRVTIAAVTAAGAHVLHLRSAASDALLASLSPRQRQLDVVQLHKVLLEHVLGISEEDIRNQKHVSYYRDAVEAVERVRQGANVAFLINPVGIEQMREVAFAGELMPQKSTDFYPKMLSGLTIYALE